MLHSLLRHHRRDFLFFTLLIISGIIWSNNVPYHHDELSALLRVQFDSFSELIEQGVRPDGHPGGMQVLLWFWTKWFGYAPVAVKVISCVSGVVSLWLLYHIARRLFGGSAANYSIALFGTLQYSVMYAGLARPYALGLLFVLLFAQGVLLLRKRPGWTAILFIILGAAGAAYTHYFAALQVLLMGVLALFYVPRRHFPRLIGASIVAFLLWLPHIGITIDQLSIGGIGDWLKPPGDGFFFSWLGYAFNYSWSLMGLLALLALVGLVLTKKARFSFWPERLGMLLLVLVPFAIAYFYSIQINPLLHQGTLYFTFPFLLLFCVSFIRLPWNWNAGLVPLIFAVGALSLFVGRQHSNTHLATEYQTSLEWLANTNAYRSDLAPLSTLIDLREDAVQFMFEQEIVVKSEVQFAWPLWNEGKLMEYLTGIEGNVLFVVINAGSNPEYLASALEVFPCISETQFYSSGAAYILNRQCVQSQRVPTIDSIQLGDQQLDSTSNSSGKLEGFWSVWESYKGDAYFHAQWTGGANSKATMVMEVNPGVEGGLWRGVELAPFYNGRDSLQHVVHCFYPEEMEYGSSDPWRGYIWWQSGEPIQVQKISLRTFPRNPIKFGLYRPIDPTTP